jgi:hypothetical protein
MARDVRKRGGILRMLIPWQGAEFMIDARPRNCLALATVALATLLASADAPGQEQKLKEQKGADTPSIEPSVWMRKKLDYSRNILAGLASEDFEKIAQNAEAMQGMSTLEGFIRGRMPGYRTQLQVFQSANEELMKQAQKDNVEGAALAFTQLTISCVNCHKQLRDTQTSAPARKPTEP